MQGNAGRRRRALIRAVLAALTCLTAQHLVLAADSSAPERNGTELGFAVFQLHCVSCHGNPAVERAPAPATLRAMSPERIYTALTTGIMKSVGDTLNETDRRRVAESLSGQFLGSEKAGDAASMPNHCSSNPPLRVAGTNGWNGWGNGLSNARFQSAAAAGLTAATVPNLKLKWAFGFPGGTSSFGQPTVMAGRVFIGSDIGYVYSLDATTGCIYWSYRTLAGVRNAMTVGPIRVRGTTRYAVYFGDLKANAYAIDAHTGAPIWKTHVEKHFATRVTAAPALYKGRLYVPISAWEGFQARVLDYPCCTADGSVSALDANTGRRIWKTYSIAQRPKPTHKNSKGVQQWAPAGVPIWNTPTIDPKRHALYVGTGDASTYPAPDTTDSILALDLKTGKKLWSHQIYEGDSFIVGCGGAGMTENCPKKLGPDWDVPMSPMLADGQDRSLLVFAMKNGDVLALDPDRKGELAWHNDHERAAASSGSYGTPTRNRGPQWGGALDQHFAYVPCSNNAIAAVSLTDGHPKWCAALDDATDAKVLYSAPLTLIPGVVFAAGSDGSLWALASEDGHTLWKAHTAMEYQTVNGVHAHGGSIVSAGSTIADGMLFVGSGYGVVASLPGNVLLAFGLP